MATAGSGHVPSTVYHTVAVGSLLGGAATVLGALADGAPLTLMALELAGAATLVAGAGAPAWAFGARRLAALSLLALAAVVALPAGALGGGLHVQRAPASRGEIEVTDPSDARVEIETADRREARPAPLSGPIAAPARVTVAAAPASTSFAVGAGERVTVSPLGASTTYRVLAVFENEHLAMNPSSRVTVRVYLFGVLEAEVSRTLERGGAIWEVADVTWPTGEVTVLP